MIVGGIDLPLLRRLDRYQKLLRGRQPIPGSVAFLRMNDVATTPGKATVGALEARNPAPT